jgi:hypothetical protein
MHEQQLHELNLYGKCIRIKDHFSYYEFNKKFHNDAPRRMRCCNAAGDSSQMILGCHDVLSIQDLGTNNN